MATTTAATPSWLIGLAQQQVVYPDLQTINTLKTKKQKLAQDLPALDTSSAVTKTEDLEQQPGDASPVAAPKKNKPGRKPATTEPANKRTAQNRAAQRAFRERKEKYLRDLENRVKELEQAHKSSGTKALVDENVRLKRKIQELESENAVLREMSFSFEFPLPNTIAAGAPVPTTPGATNKLVEEPKLLLTPVSASVTTPLETSSSSNSSLTSPCPELYQHPTPPSSGGVLESNDAFSPPPTVGPITPALNFLEDPQLLDLNAALSGFTSPSALPANTLSSSSSGMTEKSTLFPNLNFNSAAFQQYRDPSATSVAASLPFTATFTNPTLTGDTPLISDEEFDEFLHMAYSAVDSTTAPAPAPATAAPSVASAPAPTPAPAPEPSQEKVVPEAVASAPLIDDPEVMDALCQLFTTKAKCSELGAMQQRMMDACNSGDKGEVMRILDVHREKVRMHMYSSTCPMLRSCVLRLRAYNTAFHNPLRALPNIPVCAVSLSSRKPFIHQTASARRSSIHRQPFTTMSGDDSQKKPTEEVILGEDGKPLSKNALKKIQKEKEKERKRKEAAEKAAAEKAAKDAAAPDYAKNRYGTLPLNQSQERPMRQRTTLGEITPSMVDQVVYLRARVQTSRRTGNKRCFFEFRQRTETIQGVLTVDETTISRQMLDFASSIPNETLVLVEASITKPLDLVKGCTKQNVELKVQKIFVECPISTRLPFTPEEAARSAEDIDKAEQEGRPFTRVALETRLDNRVMDLRTTTNHAIFRLQGGIVKLFREFLDRRDFMEIHTPKLIGTASEGGANVFKVGYFKSEAYLAQSPQLYKQMVLSSDFERVYEIAPVFRAENSQTHRHMTEFIGLDIEMAIQEHYHEILDLFDGLFVYIFKELKKRYADEIEAVRRQYPFEEFEFLPKSLRLEYKDAVKMLRDAGVEMDDYEDLSTEKERVLGKLVKEKYNTDFFMLDKFPLSVRPFYTMPDPKQPGYSNSYDFFMRGEEILSGAQRVHDPALLEKRVIECGVDVSTIQPYVDAFKFGCPPHGGGGIGK
ncbi:aspartate--tRNA ligase dps1 [Quaeritorhiza haematococci]|nr:aspartate--tRNA ligase dps1 [Quaeritorhiza haematococci]